MSSPRRIEAGALHGRRSAVAFVTALLLACVPTVALSGFASAGDADKETNQEVKHAKKDLREAKERVRDRRAKIRALQRHMNALATRIAKAQSDIAGTEAQIAKLQRKITALQVRAALLQSKLDERGRAAYMFGGASVMYVLTATSAADAASRVSLLSEMNRRDGVLAARVRETTENIGRVEAEVVRAQNILELTKRSLELDQDALQEKMAESRRLLAGFQQRVEEIRYELSQLRPLAVCPLGGPYAIADNFGDPRPEPGGGFHWHQGDDIMAAAGTPILAPFDGVASVSHSQLGGLGVYVHGEFGYVYNAHLSRLGNLGPVEAGDVVGYVGSTGHSSGPHDHFEWHPDDGDAVDPYDFLLQVCASGASLDAT
jgi:murein DD-endopeptidase MepM/ murein hydrolase activator NlpD